MHENLLIGLVSILIIGVAAQWLAWRLRLPSILLLLICGFIAGPVTGFLKPDELLGEILLPLVSVSVAIILFEGGMSLNIAELRASGKVIRNLITVGAFLTWIISAAAAYYILQLSFPLSVLWGAILVVTGPTVIIPLLRHVRPTGAAGSVVKWEGILIDPVGAMLALLVFEAILSGGFESATVAVLSGFFKTVLIGSLAGILVAGLLVLLLYRGWIPDFLQNPVALMSVVGAYTLSNFLRAESGLLATTIMGIALTNQKWINVKHIIEFKENLRVLLIAALFIVLSARLSIDDIFYFDTRVFVFLLVLVLLARPLSTLLSARGSNLTWKDKFFIAAMAPRGVVAAAVTSVFALKLAEQGYADAERLVPLTFMVIIGTVTVYGLLAAPLARWLGISGAEPQGFLIIGAHKWAREIAAALKNLGVKVVLVDTNAENISTARMMDLTTYQGSALSEETPQHIDLTGIGRLLALTSNDEVNSLACLHYGEVFGHQGIFQLPLQSKGARRLQSMPSHLRGKFLFGPECTYLFLDSLFASGAVIKVNKLTPEFDFDSFERHYRGSAVLLFVMNESGVVTPIIADKSVTPRPGQTIVSIVKSPD
ncbi:MAG: cation:proton antiporter [bacterium]|jgi:NhaP-type Na+/H+ or K+/H+ antiporter